MKLTTGILAAVMMTGGVWAQNPNIINNVQNKMTAVEQKQTADSNAALGISDASASPQPTKPTAGAPAPGVRPAPIPGAKPVAASQPASSAAAKPANAPMPKPVTASASVASNKLERVNVVHQADDIQIEMNSREAVTPRVTKLTSPERVVVELPATAMATPQNKIPVGSAGVKGVRIGMDGKTPPTTSVVVDLEKAISYELTPGPSNKFVLTLHTQTVAKNAPAPIPAKPPQLQTVAAKPVVAPPAAALKAAKTIAVASPAAPQATKTTAVASPVAPKATAANTSAPKPPAKPTAAAATKIVADQKSAAPAKSAEALKAPKPEEKKWAMSGKRDPFFSPIVQQSAGGSGCSTGKKCLEIGQINVRGVVKAESGFIAVVTNSLNKAYFLHENDPVFNGYVMRITGDSVVFQETVQDKFGKPFTREVTKRITTPAV
jgi:Tfp pilus assembly protein PilP